MDTNQIPLNIYLDLSKAFDTLDHKILLSKLNYYGITGNALKLLENYLSNRKQYVEFNDTCSQNENITTGVPQGSILGPLLFLLYVNDISKATKIFYPINYADDTTLSTTLNTMSTVDIENELSKITDWLKLNKLSLNLSKTKAMIFHTPQRTVVPPVIKISNHVIEYVKQFNFLGIIIDSHLSWKPHIEYIAKKLSKVNAILNKLKRYLPKHILRTLYCTMFLPHITYGLLLWGCDLDRLFNLQRKALRLINTSKFNAHTEPLFLKYNLLKLPDLCTLHEMRFCYRLENKMLPSYYSCSIFTKNNSVHSYDTRNNDDYQLPSHKHSYVQRTLRYRIPDIYNSMEDNIKEKISTHSLRGFVNYAKRQFLSNYKIDCSIPNCPSC